MHCPIIAPKFDLTSIHTPRYFEGKQVTTIISGSQISAERLGAATGDEVAVHVHGASPLSMGMEREDRCE